MTVATSPLADLDRPVLATHALTVGYHDRRAGDTRVLSDLDLALPRGELTCLLGPNGSGKSTLLRTLVGMQPPLTGEVTLDGDPLGSLDAAERARRLSVVLTDRIDVGMMTGADLVALGRTPYTGWSGRLTARDHAVVRWALRSLAAERFAHRRVAQLSDGERQRVVIARALAQEPAVLALDEPTAFVDVPRRVELTQTLRHLARECDLAVLLTTHDLDLAVRVADRVWLIEPSADGARLHVGAPEDLVLSGVMARAFASDEVSFDLSRGTFVPVGHGVGTVRVEGEGVEAVWAGRALEREGFEVTRDTAVPADAVVAVRPGPVWRLTVGAGPGSEHPTLAALVAATRGVLTDAAAGERP